MNYGYYLKAKKERDSPEYHRNQQGCFKRNAVQYHAPAEGSAVGLSAAEFMAQTPRRPGKRSRRACRGYVYLSHREMYFLHNI